MVHEPRGVVALLVPWNDPLAIAGGQFAACLAAGNAVVLKPSEKTPLATIRLLELLDLPHGVVQPLLGDACAGRPLAAHPAVDLVVHTGSVTTGREDRRRLRRRPAQGAARAGGKDPLVVDAGVDPVWAAGQAAAGAFANAGQLCTSVERIDVHADVAEAFTQALVAEARSLRPGPGLDPASTIGPLIDERQREIVDGHVREAAERGAEVLTGGVVPGGAGWFYPPTVLRGVTDDLAVMREETFGPVSAVRTVGASTRRSRRRTGPSTAWPPPS